MIGKSLKGRTILVTRPEREAESLGEMLRAQGAETIEAPAIEILPPEDTAQLDRAIRDAVGGEFEWVVFTSPRAVEAVVARLVVLGLEITIPTSVAAVGEKTATTLRDLGMRVDLVPKVFTTETLADAFPPGKGRVLLPRADIAPDGLEDGLAAKGWAPHRVTAYRTRFPDELPPEAYDALEAGRIDAVVFTSTSTVRGFAHMAGVRTGPCVVCIGPVTARAAEEAGFTVDAVASPHTMEGVLKALRRTLKRRP